MSKSKTLHYYPYDATVVNTVGIKQKVRTGVIFALNLNDAKNSLIKSGYTIVSLKKQPKNS